MISNGIEDFEINTYESFDNEYFTYNFIDSLAITNSTFIN